MASNYFCIDIGEKYTKSVDIKKNEDKLDLTSIGKIETNEYFFSTDTEKVVEDQADRIKRLVETQKITKKNINIIIPGNSTYNQILTMPFLNEKELISAIKYQADQFIPMPIEETNIDIETIEEYKEEKKILILIVAAPKKLIEKIQNTVELAGLIPESMESELSAMSRFVSEYTKKITDCPNDSIIINFGGNSSNLSYYINPNYLIRESHGISFGFQLFLKEVMVNTDTDQKKAESLLNQYDPEVEMSYPITTIISPLIKQFTSEIKRFIINKKVSNIFFTNQIFLFPGLIKVIQKELGVTTNSLNPYNLFNKTELVDIYKQELPLYISSFGGNLR